MYVCTYIPTQVRMEVEVNFKVVGLDLVELLTHRVEEDYLADSKPVLHNLRGLMFYKQIQVSAVHLFYLHICKDFWMFILYHTYVHSWACT